MPNFGRRPKCQKAMSESQLVSNICTTLFSRKFFILKIMKQSFKYMK